MKRKNKLEIFSDNPDDGINYSHRINDRMIIEEIAGEEITAITIQSNPIQKNKLKKTLWIKIKVLISKYLQ